MNRSDYQQKRNIIITNIGKAYNNVLNSEKALLETKDFVNNALERKEEEKNNLFIAYTLATALPEPDKYKPNSQIEELLVTGANMAYAFALHSDYEYSTISDISKKIEVIQGSTMVSAAATYPTRTIIHSIVEEISREYMPIKNVLRANAMSTQYEKRNQIKSWLEGIDQLIAQKFKESFDNFSDNKYMSAAHAMRDALSSLWQKLSPDDEILKTPWYKKDESNEGKPTQKQRIKYAIIGSNMQVSDEDINLIEALAKEGRDIYTKLSSEAHRREGDWDESTINVYLSIGESTLEQIMNLRKKLTGTLYFE